MSSSPQLASLASSLTPSVSLSGILVGDELGQVKHIDFASRNNIVNINSDIINSEPSPSKPVTCISAFEHEESNILYLITNKPNTISMYNCINNNIKLLKSPNNESNIVGAQAIARSNIVVCYENGSIFMQNIEKDILESSETKKKAIKLLGLDLASEISSTISNTTNSSNKSKSNSTKTISSKTSTLPRAKPSQQANLCSSVSSSKSSSSLATIFSPNWNTSSTSLTCFKTCNNRLAIAGRNVDLKVFDLSTKQCIFTAKSSNRDWLGIKHQTWVSDLDWVGGNLRTNTQPSMIATCSRSDSCIRIYDLKEKQRKPIMNINLKDQTFNNDSNPPSFTSICATSAPHSIAVPTQNIILGTTMGRMMAVDLRFNSHSYRHLGVFKGFGGGAIRDIKYVNQGLNSFKILSCSLDRFVRLHTFNILSTSSRHLDRKFYVKTRPTCIQPICSSFNLAPIVRNEDDSDSSDFDQ